MYIKLSFELFVESYPFIHKIILQITISLYKLITLTEQTENILLKNVVKHSIDLSEPSIITCIERFYLQSLSDI